MEVEDDWFRGMSPERDMSGAPMFGREDERTNVDSSSSSADLVESGMVRALVEAASAEEGDADDGAVAEGEEVASVAGVVDEEAAVEVFVGDFGF